MARMHINVSGIVKELFERNNIQVHSLDALDADLRQQFAHGKKKALIFFRGTVLQTIISETGNRRLLLPPEVLPAGSKAGEKIIVILPAERDNMRYVLQAFIKNVFIDRVDLQIMDPRYYRRVRPVAKHNILVRNVPPQLLLELQAEKLQLVREMEGLREDEETTVQEEALPPEEGKTKKRKTAAKDVYEDPVQEQRITDLLCEEEGEIAAGYKALLQDSPLSGTLVDFSCGGMSIATKNGDGAELPNGLLYCNFDLSRRDGIGNTISLEVNIFAIVRSHKATAKGHLLSLMFLSRLPEDILLFLE
ncbi:MAG: hypothetical protein A2512_00145 [Deltaproteobacteria bacterium RIFOXYD12_FULL_56_24]|nr:MAG: hypothetical protein A2512_00145 [Deltaproteobacteria bacterium RIFOXYD12_FULL_56_24]